jgi:hypothetical protein
VLAFRQDARRNQAAESIQTNRVRDHARSRPSADKPCDLWSHKFIRQKLNYIHHNPVRAGLCEHPANWEWSSYHAYLPHEPGAVPIEMDWRGYWNLEAAGMARL